MRTGPELAAIDLDGKNGVDPQEALGRLLARLPEGVAVYRTRRGFGVLFRPLRPVGDGPLPAYGGELFSAGHLVNIPPSRHPEGINYEWEIPPGGSLPVVDLEALGLTPVHESASPATRPRRDGRQPPAPTEVQEEFRRLMAQAGVSPRRGGEELAHCPWHEDRHPSLSVNWEAAVFNCHACGAQGGMRALRRLLGQEETPQVNTRARGAGDRANAPIRIKATPSEYDWANASIYSRAGPGVKSGGSTPDPDLKAARRRLCEGLAIAEQGADGALPAPPRGGLWSEEVLKCQAIFRAGVCTNCGARLAFPLSCGFPLCPRCMPSRLAADWQRHGETIPEPLTLVRLHPVAPEDGPGVVKRLRGRFAEWRKRCGLSAGIYGIRLRWEGGRLRASVLLAVPDAEAERLESGRAFEVEAVASGQSPADTLRWLQDAYLEEATSWATVDELLALVAEVKGRRRFQGFGKAYGRREKADAGEDDPPAKALGRVSGGACKGGWAREEAPTCPLCGGQVDLYCTVGADQVEEVSGPEGVWYRWTGPPGAHGPGPGGAAGGRARQ